MQNNRRLNDFERTIDNGFALNALNYFTKSFGDFEPIYFCCKDKYYREDILGAYINTIKDIDGIRRIKTIKAKEFLVNKDQAIELLFKVDNLVITDINEIEDNDIMQDNLIECLKVSKLIARLLLISADKELEALNFKQSLNNEFALAIRLRIFEK